MKTEGKITFLINKEGTAISIRDKKSECIILKVELTPDQLSSALSRLGDTDCSLDVSESSFAKIGKQHECKTHEFKLPESYSRYKRGEEEKLHSHAVKTCPEGWETDLYFGSQDSFFSKGNEDWARCTIRRWI